MLRNQRALTSTSTGRGRRLLGDDRALVGSDGGGDHLPLHRLERCHVGAAVTEQEGEALRAAGLHGAPSRQRPNCCDRAQEQPAHTAPSRPLHARAHAIQRGGARHGGGAPAPAAVPREDVEDLALPHHLHACTTHLSSEAREGNAGRIDAHATHRGHIRGGHAEAIVRAAQYTVALDSRKCVLCELDTVTHLEAERRCTPRMHARCVQLQRKGRKAESRWQVKRQQHAPGAPRERAK